MKLEMDHDRKLRILGVSAVAIVTVLSYFAHTPLKFFACLIGIVVSVYAARKLHSQFNVPLGFIRRGDVNYWSGAFGGLIGFFSGYYGVTRDIETISPAEFGVDLSLITIYLVLGCMLFMGAILQDIEDGYIEL